MSAQSKAVHTAGPWAATTRQGSWDWLVYSVSDPNIEICQPFHDGSEFNELGEANAHLIAAAPELEDVCLSFSVIERKGSIVLRVRGTEVAAVAGDTTEGMVLRQLGENRRAAIAAAKGGAS